MKNKTKLENRGTFTGKIGFVLAAAGSAVGLGNIWRFPYLAAEYGGGIFLLIYLLLAVTLGFALMAAEILIGRKTGLSAVSAFKKLDGRFSFLGSLASIIPVIILPYYCVIGGWVMKYSATFAFGEMNSAAADGYFTQFISNPVQPIGWFLLFLGVTAVVVLFGVEKGVERVSKVMMPLLVIMVMGVTAYILCQPGALEGVKYYLVPDFNNFKATTILAAMGQLFYSMSLAMGIMITYGSYMKKDVNVESSVHNIEIFDTGIAFLAGLMIVPAVFATQGVEMSKGPGLMFMVLPKVFAKMPGGAVIGFIFFALVFFAAITSSISLMETVVSIVKDKFKLGRKLSCAIVLAICLILGIPSALSNGEGILSGFKIIGFGFLDFCDFMSNSVLMPIVALITCIFIGYVLKPKALIEEAETNGNKFKAKRLFTVVIKYVAPICITLILIFSILEGCGVLKV